MRSSIVPVLLWSYWANLIYLFGMVGYLLIDTLYPFVFSSSSTLVSSIYLFLTILFIVDALLYTIDWYFYAVKLRKNPDDPIEYRCEFFACVFQTVGSVFYFLGALFAFGQRSWSERSLLMNLFGIIALLIESLLTLAGWWVVHRRTELVHPDNGWSCRVRTTNRAANSIDIFVPLEYLPLGSRVKYRRQYDLPFFHHFCLSIDFLQIRFFASNHRGSGVLNRRLFLPSMLVT